MPGHQDQEEALHALWAYVRPYLQLLGGSGVAGLVAGVALRRVGQALAVTMAIAAIGLKVLEHYDFVTVHWDRLQDATQSALDANRDGALNFEDARAMLQHLNFLTAGLPSIGSFIAGILLGARL